MPQDLSTAHLILLAVAYASDANIPALRTVTLSAPKLFKPELVLRILLSFLPESLDPDVYTNFLSETVSSDELSNEDVRSLSTSEPPHFDDSPIEQLSSEEAKEKLNKLYIKRLRPSKTKTRQDGILQHAPKHPLVLFLIQRAHAIEKETGLLAMVSSLIEPFIDQYPYLKTWYLSTVLPLLRFDYEFYQEDAPAIDLETFEDFEGAAGVNVLMSRSTLASREGTGNAESVGRDLRGMVGPWTYGSTQRKRRKLEGTIKDKNISRGPLRPTQNSLPGSTEYSKTESSDDLAGDIESKLEPSDQLEDWQFTFRWMVTSAVDNFALAVQTVEGWRGPNDIDFGDVDPSSLTQRSDQVQSQLHLRYCQAALATIYAAESDSSSTMEGAHRILTLVAEMMGYPTPAALGAHVSLLPSLEQQIGEPAQPLEQYPQEYLQFKELLQEQQPLTMPTMEAYALLHLLIHSAHALTTLGFCGSIAQVAKICFYGDAADSHRLLQKILEHLSAVVKPNEEQWSQIRQQLLWLWDWNTIQESHGSAQPSQGILRQLPRSVVEEEVLKAICSAGHFTLARSVYLTSDAHARPLSSENVESTIVGLFNDHYSAASNGNRTRGFMKKASDLLSAFQSAFSTVRSFRQASALLTATHALSFYTLTLDPGKPTPPARIRDFEDPLALIRIVLSQNPRSYTKLDDLIGIASNLVISNPNALSSTETRSSYTNASVDFPNNESARTTYASRLVTGMAIEAALEEDDFETAYSYVVNRLSLASPSQHQTRPVASEEVPDDTSWRAAYAAGRHRSTLSAKAPSHERSRRLEQRMDLLSRALSLGPGPALPEILAAWRRCEEELMTLLQDEAQAEAEADAIADKRLSGSMRMSGSQELPGAFGGEQPPLVQGQPRRKEMGRSNRVDGEAPMGLFDVARGAAQAFGRMGQKGQKPAMPQRAASGEIGEDFEDGQERVRKRDMVANAVTGGMARGIGWVLGATPVSEADRE